MKSAVLEQAGWIEEESFLSEHWNEMVIKNPAVPFAGIWRDGICIHLYPEPSGRPISLLK